MKSTEDQLVKPKNGKGCSDVATNLRYLAMLEFIPRQPASVSVDEIIQALNQRGYLIDKRSIQRDLIKLAQTFQLLSSKQKNTKHWSYAHDAPIRLFPSMDQHTALSFQLMNAYMQPLLAPKTLESIAPLFKKSAELLSKRTEVAARWQEKILVMPLGLSRLPPKVNAEVQKVIYQALLEECALRVKYRRANASVANEHLISPLGVVVRDYISYVVLVLNRSGNKGYWPLHRFEQAVMAKDDDYVRPDLFNLEVYANAKMNFTLSTAPTLMDELPLMQLELWMDKIVAVSVIECPISSTQTVSKQADGSFLLSATVADTHELRCWIRSQGKQLEVLQPIPLRVTIAEEIAELWQKYNPAILQAI